MKAKEKLSTAVREAMEANGLNADGLAARAKLARSTVFKLLDDFDDVRVSTLRKLKKIGVKHPLVEAA
jgi:predicted transcriptional regulator